MDNKQNKLFINVKKRLPTSEISNAIYELNAFSNDFVDPMLKEAAFLILQNQQCSVSLLQRRLKLGHSRATRIVDQLEDTGIVGPNDGSENRIALIKDQEQLEILLRKIL